MAQNFGIGLVIGATVAASVSSAFSTVEQKIKSARAEMGKSQSAMRRTTAAMDAKAKLDSLKGAVRENPADKRLSAELVKAGKAYSIARAEAKKYGTSVAEWRSEHEKAARALERSSAHLKAQTRLQAESKRRNPVVLRQDSLPHQ